MYCETGIILILNKINKLTIIYHPSLRTSISRKFPNLWCLSNLFQFLCQLRSVSCLPKTPFYGWKNTIVVVIPYSYFYLLSCRNFCFCFLLSVLHIRLRRTLHFSRRVGNGFREWKVARTGMSSVNWAKDRSSSLRSLDIPSTSGILSRVRCHDSFRSLSVKLFPITEQVCNHKSNSLYCMCKWPLPKKSKFIRSGSL